MVSSPSPVHVRYVRGRQGAAPAECRPSRSPGTEPVGGEGDDSVAREVQRSHSRTLVRAGAEVITSRAGSARSSPGRGRESPRPSGKLRELWRVALASKAWGELQER